MPGGPTPQLSPNPVWLVRGPRSQGPWAFPSGSGIVGSPERVLGRGCRPEGRHLPHRLERGSRATRVPEGGGARLTVTVAPRLRAHEARRGRPGLGLRRLCPGAARPAPRRQARGPKSETCRRGVGPPAPGNARRPLPPAEPSPQGFPNLRGRRRAEQTCLQKTYGGPQAPGKARVRPRSLRDCGGAGEGAGNRRAGPSPGPSP